MKRIFSLAITLLFSLALHAQRTVKLNRLWTKPQVHVLYGDYTISFKIKDINRALDLLDETGNKVYGKIVALDTNQQYNIELFPGVNAAYQNDLQPLMQHTVGPFLLLSGQARVRRKRKKLKEVVANIEIMQRDDSVAYIFFTDPKTQRELFSGSMPVNMYNQDIGIY